jgi:myosin-5
MKIKPPNHRITEEIENYGMNSRLNTSQVSFYDERFMNRVVRLEVIRITLADLERAHTDSIIRAGDVSYTITDFLEKNKDSLSPKLLREVLESKIDLLREEYTDRVSVSNISNVPGNTSSVRGINTPSLSMKCWCMCITCNRFDSENERIQQNLLISAGRRTSTRNMAGKLTLTAKFKMDLDNLMTSLRETIPHFVRCVKPNGLQAPDRFEGHIALNQLKYSGQ